MTIDDDLDVLGLKAELADRLHHHRARCRHARVEENVPLVVVNSHELRPIVPTK